MSKSRKRSISTAQLKLRELLFSIAGTGANTVSGPDRLLVSSVTDLGTGNYLVILTGVGASQSQKDVVLKGFSTSTADVALQVTAVDHDRITVQCTASGVAADADITLCLSVQDSRFEYAS
jgi:hypothetical protein